MSDERFSGASGPVRHLSALWALHPVASVAIAVLAAHALDLQDAWWAAISAYVVMQGSAADSLYRGGLRILGTLVGAVVGWWLSPTLTHHAAMLVLLLGLASWGGLYAGTVMRHGYAWVLGLVTFVMVVCQAWEQGAPIAPFALERVANIMLGVVVCVAVSIATDMRSCAPLLGTARSQPAGWPTALAPWRGAVAPVVDRRQAAMHTLPGAIAVALLCALMVWRHPSGVSQAMVTALIVLVVPLGSDAAEVGQRVSARIAQRILGCLLAALLALGLLQVLDGKPLLCQVGLAMGVWAGAWVQMNRPRLSYGALQFSVAFMMVFVQDQGWSVSPDVAWQRLSGMSAGVAMICAVRLLAWALMWLRRPGAR